MGSAAIIGGINQFFQRPLSPMGPVSMPAASPTGTGALTSNIGYFLRQAMSPSGPALMPATSPTAARVEDSGGGTVR
jgi:hypothetical protein